MSQKHEILSYLRGHDTITPLEALGVLGVYRLAARIGELRDEGYDIKTVMKRDPKGKPFAQYSLT